MRIYSIFLAALFSCLMLTGQKPVDIMLKSSPSKDQAKCFDIQLRSPAGHDIDLAGQNYRIFYNANHVSFLEDRISHNLDRETYGKMDVINTVDDNIGFVSLSLDSRVLTDKIVKLDRSGDWAKTLNVCFSHDKKSSVDLTWAHAEKTSRFATAEIAMSEWVDEDNQQILTPNEVIDFNSEEQEDFYSSMNIHIYPNPVAQFVNLELKGDNSVQNIVIKDVIGREVINQRVENAGLTTYDIGGWPEGAYTVIVLDEDGKRLTSKKVIKVNSY